jgi:hypothetical protein
MVTGTVRKSVGSSVSDWRRVESTQSSDHVVTLGGVLDPSPGRVASCVPNVANATIATVADAWNE